jgi:hypothetical protein
MEWFQEKPHEHTARNCNSKSIFTTEDTENTEDNVLQETSKLTDKAHRSE